LSLPVEIDGSEVLLRSLRKKDVSRLEMVIKVSSLKPGSKDRNSLSLIREAIGVEAARAAAIEHVHHEEFWGFGAAAAGELREHSKSLRDDRAAFYGHAEMELGFEIPAGPPNTPPDMTAVYEAAVQRLIALAKVFRVAETRLTG
jgi:hypothetical protein